MLVTTKQILAKAQKGRYAVPAFNINNLEILDAVMRAATKLKSPVILSTSEGAIEYAGMNNLYTLMKEASKAKIPVAIHLDHGKNIDIIAQAINTGYSSVMIDASALPYEENVAKTKLVVALAKKKRVSVEAELGALSGIEDFVSVSQKDAHLTSPAQAKEFVRRTKCDSLAVAIGTSHGSMKFKGKPQLDFKRLFDIKKSVSVPLVLHGASEVDEKMVARARNAGSTLSATHGVTNDLLRKAIKMGICKVNTDTDLRIAFTAGIRETLKNDTSIWDPRKIMAPAIAAMQEAAERRIKACGSNKKA